MTYSEMSPSCTCSSRYSRQSFLIWFISPIISLSWSTALSAMSLASLASDSADSISSITSFRFISRLLTAGL